MKSSREQSPDPAQVARRAVALAVELLEQNNELSACAKGLSGVVEALMTAADIARAALESGDTDKAMALLEAMTWPRRRRKMH